MKASIDIVITAAVLCALAIGAFNAGELYVRHQEICVPAPHGAEVESFSMKPLH